ncbi:GntR family transcriptional regulator [Paraburkholderia flagellata]|uniref:GntR family transcriptional regulator n=1 Tax=Paraburkholderia flagellata TaxID=2883241 RepID=UPI001F2BE486|nr:GntR family transcriptional regulator [Paraburkholderia flagellata]
MADGSQQETNAPRRRVLKQVTLVDTIYEKVRERLRRGEVAPNERLLDYQIADEFGCTRMPVREALLRLVKDGQLVGTTRGFVIPRLSDKDVREIYEVRRLLEPAAAASTATALSEDQLAALSRIYKKAVRACETRDAGAMVEASAEFRDIWLGAVENERLRTAIIQFAEHPQRIRLATLQDNDAREIFVEGLRTLLDGFLTRDRKQIRASLQKILLAAEQHYFALSESED